MNKASPSRHGQGNTAGETDRPNIVIIMTDQQRADFSRAEGYRLDTTPFIDELGSRGSRFRRAYTPMPICMPARCSMFSGRFPKATRVRQNSGRKNMHGPRDLVDILRELGYSIALAGKNHSHLTSESFDFVSEYTHIRGAEGSSSDEREFEAWMAGLMDHDNLPEPTPFPVECQFPFRIVRDAVSFVEQNGDRPFFLWLSFPEPHNPYQAPEPYFSLFPESEIPDRAAGPEACDIKGPMWRWERRLIEEKRPGYDDAWRRYRATYCGMLRLLDDQVRRFVKSLETAGKLANTILIFTSDHGDYAGDYGLQRKGVGMPECLARVPLVIEGPGIEVAGMRDEFVSLVDLMPTLCEALGVEIPFGVQGRSLWPVLSGAAYPAEEFRSIYVESGYGGIPYPEEARPPLHFPYEGPRFDELNSVTQAGNQKMVRMGSWKLIFDAAGGGELYDLDTDPAEVVNLYGKSEFLDRQRQLAEELLRWTIRSEDDLPGGSYTPNRAPRNWLVK